MRNVMSQTLVAVGLRMPLDGDTQSRLRHETIGDFTQSYDHDEHHRQTKGEQGAGANRRGCSLAHAFRNFNPPFRLHAHPRPGGRHSLDVRPRNRVLARDQRTQTRIQPSSLLGDARD